MNRWLLPTIVAANLLLAGCSSGPRLPAPSRAYPDVIGFAGRWERINVEMRDSLKPRGIRLKVPNTNSGAIRVERDDRPGMNVRNFLEQGGSLRITELDSALLISFDRSVVEEYRYGEQRIINIGQIRAERTAGWQNDTLVISTIDDDDALLKERWRLRGKLLERVATIRLKDDELLYLRERFQRTSR